MSGEASKKPRRDRASNEHFDHDTMVNDLFEVAKTDVPFTWDGSRYLKKRKGSADRPSLNKHALALAVFLSHCPSGFMDQVAVRAVFAALSKKLNIDHKHLCREGFVFINDAADAWRTMSSHLGKLRSLKTTGFPALDNILQDTDPAGVGTPATDVVPEVVGVVPEVVGAAGYDAGGAAQLQWPTWPDRESEDGTSSDVEITAVLCKCKTCKHCRAKTSELATETSSPVVAEPTRDDPIDDSSEEAKKAKPPPPKKGAQQDIIGGVQRQATDIAKGKRESKRVKAQGKTKLKAEWKPRRRL